MSPVALLSPLKKGFAGLSPTTKARLFLLCGHWAYIALKGGDAKAKSESLWNYFSGQACQDKEMNIRNRRNLHDPTFNQHPNLAANGKAGSYKLYTGPASLV